MLIANEIKTRSIQIECIGAERKYYSSYELNISFKTEYIATVRDFQTWVSEDDLNTFISELNFLEKSRAGLARLKSMSPHEFELALKNMDNAGHIVVQFVIKKDLRYRELSFELLGEFEIDPTSLPTLLAEFEALKHFQA